MRWEPEGRGVTLVETMIAILVAFIAMAAVGGVVFSALVGNKNQGTETVRAMTLAQEKMNELMRLNYTDTSTNTTLITDANWSVGLADNGGTSFLTACPAGINQGYVDFLDVNGNGFTGSCSTVIAQPYRYERRWQISPVLDSSGNPINGLKQITVVVYDLASVSTSAATTPPYVTLTSMKSQ